MENKTYYCKDLEQFKKDFERQFKYSNRLYCECIEDDEDKEEFKNKKQLLKYIENHWSDTWACESKLKVKVFKKVIIMKLENLTSCGCCDSRSWDFIITGHILSENDIYLKELENEEMK